MIKFLSCRQINIADRFFRLEQLFCDSVKKSGVDMGFLKHSRFSHFMGLSTEMKNLSKKQQLNQKKEIRQAQMFTTLAIIGIATIVIFLYFNQKITFRINMMLKMIRPNSGKRSKQNKQSTLNLLVEMQKYLIANPYQYKPLLDSIFLILSSLPTDEQNEEIQQKIEQIYLKILEHNFKSVTNQCLKNGLQKLIERRFFSHKRIDKKITEVLLSFGSIKQLYLTVKYLQLIEDTNWMLSTELKLKFIANYQRNIEKNKKYFSLIFSKIDESKIPILSSYKRIQQSRLSYIQKFLKNTVK